MRIRSSDWLPAIRPLDRGHVHIAIGDVHGRADLLEALHRALQSTLQRLAPAHTAVIYLGDLIDKGPQSRRALALARHGLPNTQNHLLLGNHEDRLLRLLDEDDPVAFARWMQHGGQALFDELAVSDVANWRDAVRSGLGASTLDWLRQGAVMLRLSDLVYVHAGIDVRVALARQSRQDLLWTRGSWIESRGPYEDDLAFIHGHTPVAGVDLTNRHRINLDTGASETGILSALLIHESRMKLIQTVPAPPEPQPPFH